MQEGGVESSNKEPQCNASATCEPAGSATSPVFGRETKTAQHRAMATSSGEDTQGASELVIESAPLLVESIQSLGTSSNSPTIRSPRHACEPRPTPIQAECSREEVEQRDADTHIIEARRSRLISTPGVTLTEHDEDHTERDADLPSTIRATRTTQEHESLHVFRQEVATEANSGTEGATICASSSNVLLMPDDEQSQHASITLHGGPTYISSTSLSSDHSAVFTSDGSHSASRDRHMCAVHVTPYDRGDGPTADVLHRSGMTPSDVSVAAERSMSLSDEDIPEDDGSSGDEGGFCFASRQAVSTVADASSSSAFSDEDDDF